jgi:kynurenine formamidase
MIIDLTFTATDTDKHEPNCIAKFIQKETPLQSEQTSYTGITYDFSINSMAGTYIDFPGHIKETDNNKDAENYPIEKLYRRSATVIHLDRKSGSGAVTAKELQTALAATTIETPILIVNALGNRRFDDIEKRSVYLTMDAVDWIISTGIEILVSDIYESPALNGVFLELFKNGISTVCNPVNINKLNCTKCNLTILPLKMRGITQLPCRLIGEFST